MKRNYKTTVKAFTKDKDGKMVEIEVPSYATEEVNPIQWAFGCFTDKSVTLNEDGTKKEDHTVRNVLIALGVAGAGYYMYKQNKGDNQTVPAQIPANYNYQPQQTYQIPQQAGVKYQTYMENAPAQPLPVEETVPVETTNDVQITEF